MRCALHPKRLPGPMWPTFYVGSSLPEGTVYFSSDGRYRQGAIQGRSVALQPAGYIGASTRRENRRRQIAALSLQIEEQQQQIHATLEQIHRAETDLSLLQNGYEQRPTTADLAACLQLASTQRAEMEQKERIHEDRRQRFLHQQEQANALRAQLLPLTKDYCPMSEMPIPMKPWQAAVTSTEACFRIFPPTNRSWNSPKAA